MKSIRAGIDFPGDSSILARQLIGAAHLQNRLDRDAPPCALLPREEEITVLAGSPDSSKPRPIS